MLQHCCLQQHGWSSAYPAAIRVQGQPSLHVRRALASPCMGVMLRYRQVAALANANYQHEPTETGPRDSKHELDQAQPPISDSVLVAQDGRLNVFSFNARSAAEVATVLQDIKVRQVVEGVVLKIQNPVALVDVGGLTGVLNQDEVSKGSPSGQALNLFKPGDHVKAVVLSWRLQSDGDAVIQLSTRRLEPSPGDMVTNRQLVYDRAEEMAARWVMVREERELRRPHKRTTRDANEALQKLLKLQEGQVVEGVITGVRSNKYAALTIDGLRGMLHPSQVSNNGLPSASIQEMISAGGTIKAVVLGWELRSSGSSRIILSTRFLNQPPGGVSSEAGGVHGGVWPLKRGTVVEGVVCKHAKEDAVRVDVSGLPGLLHLRSISTQPITREKMEQQFKEGDKVKAMVLGWTASYNGRIQYNLSATHLKASPGNVLVSQARREDASERVTAGPSLHHKTDQEPFLAMLGASQGSKHQRSTNKVFQAQRDKRLDEFQVGQLVDGVVRNVQPYGAFIDIGSSTGLLHISQVSQERVKAVENVFKKGDHVRVLVLSTGKSRDRLTLSTKQLEPSPGDMLKNKELVYDMAEEMAADFRKRRAEREAKQQK